jgi:hypothetical protein
MVTTATRLERLEAALGGGGAPGCPTCRARRWCLGPRSPPAPDWCPAGGARWARSTFTLQLGTRERSPDA